MKKILLIFITACSIFGCSNDTNEITKEEENINFDFQAKDFFCGPSHHLEFTIFDELRLFKKSGCDDGFGFCFGIRLNIEFDCVRNTITTTANNQNVNYNDNTQEARALGIADPSKKEITFYFHRNISNSPEHTASDFATIDIEDGFQMNDKVTLIGGSYAKIVEGEFYKYIVPYN